MKIEEIKGEEGLHSISKIKIFTKIEVFSKFYKVTDDKGKVRIRKEINYDNSKSR